MKQEGVYNNPNYMPTLQPLSLLQKVKKEEQEQEQVEAELDNELRQIIDDFR